jgi:hypothetical protein
MAPLIIIFGRRLRRVVKFRPWPFYFRHITLVPRGPQSGFVDFWEKRNTCCRCLFLTRRTCMKFVKAAVGGP